MASLYGAGLFYVIAIFIIKIIELNILYSVNSLKITVNN